MRAQSTIRRSGADTISEMSAEQCLANHNPSVDRINGTLITLINPSMGDISDIGIV
jgi:hypothetical protein